MQIDSTDTPGRAWLDGRWLILVEFALVAAIFVARHHHILKVSNRVADLGRGTRTAWIVSLFVISALFGFSHYQQGLTGIIEKGSDGLILGLMYLAYRRTSPFPSSPTASAIPSTLSFFSSASIPAF